MTTPDHGRVGPGEDVCAECGKPVKRNEGYLLGSRFLCPDCCMEALMKPKRKSHWQYLGSIKTGYLKYPDEN